MTRSRFTEEQIIGILREQEAGVPVADLCRKHGLSSPTFYKWKAKYGGMDMSEARRLKALEEQLSGNTAGLTKKEVLQLTRERDKLELSLGGIRDMGGVPDVMFVIDANKEELAIKEANTLGIPVVAILDSNVSPDGIAFPVPANDDAARAIRLYCEAIAIAATRGNQQQQASRGVDLGAMSEPPAEEALAEAPAAEAPAAAEGEAATA